MVEDRYALVEFTANPGMKHLDIELTGYKTEMKSHKQPDGPEAMRQTHEAGRHNLWFREQVNTALNEANSEHATWVEPDDVRTRIKHRAKRLMDSVND